MADAGAVTLTAAGGGPAPAGGGRNRRVHAADTAGQGAVEADWIAAAREMLIAGGIASVQIKPLAERLGVTRGGFYWRFRNRQDLLDQLLVDWEKRNTRPFLKAAERAGTPRERFRRMVRLWMDEKDFDPVLDTAVRHWASVDPKVAEKVHQADDARIAALTSLFLATGEEPTRAMVRARVVYFHQIGYYALNLRETPAQRRKLLPIYDEIMTDFRD